jgi:uncharacterized membrane protein
MPPRPSASPSSLRARVALVDAARGVAILAMVAYHVGWDLWYLGFIGGDITVEPGWVLFQRAIVSSFLGLVGVGLALAHADGIRWRPFWRRFALILGAALLTTLGTFLVFPDYFVYFGVLHAIALFSLLGLAFVRWPGWAVLLAGSAVIALAALVPPHPVMMQRPLSWIGFWPLPPPTTDIVPVFPWFGVVLLGLGAALVLRRTALWPALARPRLDHLPGRVLRGLGRWSLLVYLVHQPLLFGGLSLLTAPSPPDDVAFVRSCESACTGDAAFCARYCLCALEEVEKGNLWSAVNAPSRSDAEQVLVDAVAGICTADAAQGTPP